MLQRVFVPVLFATILVNAPAFAITAQEKMKTCEFGANDQKLAGAARKTFMSKCMANEDKAGAAKKKSQPMQPEQRPSQM
jgi:psiF repeat